jgi:uncharacterized membrane protein HdeD (DUF308 family)
MTPMKWISVVLAVLGLLALIAGIIYFTVPAHSLPSFLGPIPIPRVKPNAHRKRRGEAAIVIAVVLWVIAGIVFYVDNRSRTRAAAEPTMPPAPQS